MKYEVDFKEVNIYNFIIEADNEEQAEDKAYDFYEQALANNNLSDYSYDSFSEVSEVGELIEVNNGNK